MKYQLIGNKIEFGEKKCSCKDGKYQRTETCRNCDGKSLYWKRKKCPVCNNRTFVNLDIVICGNCQGTQIVPMTRYDYCELTDFTDNWKYNFIIRGQNITKMEEYFGMGFYSATDYGRIMEVFAHDIELGKSQLIAKFLEQRTAQFCKFVDEDNTPHFNIYFLIGNNGYSVVAK